MQNFEREHDDYEATGPDSSGGDDYPVQHSQAVPEEPEEHVEDPADAMKAIADLEVRAMLLQEEALKRRSEQAAAMRRTAGNILDEAERQYDAQKAKAQRILDGANELCPTTGTVPVGLPKGDGITDDTQAIAATVSTPSGGAKAKAKAQRKPAKPTKKTKAKRKPAPTGGVTVNPDDLLKVLPKKEKAGINTSSRSALAEKHGWDPNGVGRAAKILVDQKKAKMGGNPPRWTFYYKI